MGTIQATTTQLNTIVAKGLRGNAVGTIELSAQASTALTTDYTAILGTFNLGTLDNLFTSNADGSLEYLGTDTVKLLINGTSDCEVSSASTVTYGLFVDKGSGYELVPGRETPHVFGAASKTENLSMTTVYEVEPGWKFQVHAKCSGSTTLTVDTLSVSFHES